MTSGGIPAPPGLPAPSKESKILFGCALPSVQEDAADPEFEHEEELAPPARQKESRETLSSNSTGATWKPAGRMNPAKDDADRSIPRAFTDPIAQQQWKMLPMHPHSMIPGMPPNFLGMDGFLPAQVPQMQSPTMIHPVPAIPEGAPLELLAVQKDVSKLRDQLERDVLIYENQRLALENKLLRWESSMMPPTFPTPPPSQPPHWRPTIPVPNAEPDGLGKAYSATMPSPVPMPMPQSNGLGARAYSAPGAVPINEKETKKYLDKKDQGTKSGAFAPEFAPFDTTEESRELTCSEDHAGNQMVKWPVESRKLLSTDKQVISPQFEAGGAHFRLMLKPTCMGNQKGQASFRKAKGRGSIELKLVDGAAPKISFSFSVGLDEKEVPQRGPVHHDFGNGIVCGLPQNEQEWSFDDAVDRSTGTFQVCLHLKPVEI
jgi:hypothetical protein